MNKEEFKDARRRIGYSQKQLAEKLGWSVQQVSYIENGARQIQKQTELAIKYLLQQHEGA